VTQKLFRRRRGRRLGEGAPDVDAGVVVRAADAGSPVRLDVDRGRHVELASAGAVAGLPDRKQLREASAVTGGERGRYGEERVCQRAGDLALVEVRGAGLEVVRVRLEELVVGRGDPVTEDVDRLWLAGEPGGELLGDEDVRAIRELEAAGDRVVVGDRDEVHPPALGQLVDLLRRGGALGQPDAALDSELRLLGCGRVTVHVGP
jgi:hypothetical protein